MSFSDDLASFGRGTALISAILATFFGGIFIIIGIVLLTRKYPPAKPEPGPGPVNPPDAAGDAKIVGIIMIVFGIIFIVVSWLWFYLAKKSKGVAEAAGVISGVDIAESLFQ